MKAATAFLAACFCASLAYADVPPPPKAGNTVSILSNKDLSGTGVHIGGGLIVTAAHVVRDVKILNVGLSDGGKMPAVVLFTDATRDIAFIAVKKFDGMEAASLACRMASVGEEVSAIGHPGGTVDIQTWGRVAGKPREAGPWRTALPLDLRISPGNSGGPLFDAKGEVVGIVVGIQTVPLDPFGEHTTTSVAFAVPATVACDARDYLGLV
jgi:S1-C subfamily serine protease